MIFTKFEVGQPIVTYNVLLPISYVTLWPWPLISLTLNVCIVLAVTLWNSVPSLSAVEQSATQLFRF